MGTLRIALLGLVALSAGCAASHPSTTPSPKQDAGAEASVSSPVQVEIDNQNYSDMDVYLVNNGMHLLLGSAPGLSKTTLALPKAGSAGGQLQVRLLADPVGGDLPIRTPALVVAPGQNVYWTIGSDPNTSFASAG